MAVTIVYAESGRLKGWPLFYPNRTPPSLPQYDDEYFGFASIVPFGGFGEGLIELQILEDRRRFKRKNLADDGHSRFLSYLNYFEAVPTGFEPAERNWVDKVVIDIQGTKHHPGYFVCLIVFYRFWYVKFSMAQWFSRQPSHPVAQNTYPSVPGDSSRNPRTY